MSKPKMTPDRARRIAAWLRQMGCAKDGATIQEGDDVAERLDTWADEEEKALDDDSGRPYWMWHAMLSALAERACDLEGCESSDCCITEWCLPCAARAFLRTGGAPEDELVPLKTCLDETNEALKTAGFPTVCPTPGPDGDEGISPADQVGAMAAEIERLKKVAVRALTICQPSFMSRGPSEEEARQYVRGLEARVAELESKRAEVTAKDVKAYLAAKDTPLVLQSAHDRKVAELEEERPYWLWRAMLDACADRTCEKTGCKSSALCITEWCVPCAAREFRYGIMKKEAKGGGE